MFKEISVFAAIIMMAIAGNAFAQDDASAVVGEVQFISQPSRDKSVERTLFGQMLYLEKSVSADYSVFGNAYRDAEFHSMGVGIARKFGDLQVAIGVGKAYYGGRSYTTVTPWVFYSSDDWDAFGLAERYLKDQDEPWFLKGYAVRKYGKTFVGVYGESGVGLGPIFGYKLGESAKISLAVPVAGKPKEGGVKFTLNLTIGF